MNVILLSGGFGVRLWPLSNEEHPKQFLKIFLNEKNEKESMLQRMYRLIKSCDSGTNITIAASSSQLGLIHEQLPANVRCSLEPCRRDTFPAIALSVAYLHDVLRIPEDDSVVVCPVDHMVDKSYFDSLKKMYESTKDSTLTLMGIDPLFPTDKYGYILRKQNGKIVFKEKPSVEVAKDFIADGALWNSGVFAFKLKYVLEKSKSLLGFSKYEELLSNYEKLQKISFDYAVSEHESNIDVFPFHGKWKDLGTWDDLVSELDGTFSGKVYTGEKCKNTTIVNRTEVPVVALGLEDLVIVNTENGLLITKKELSTDLKKYIEDLV